MKAAFFAILWVWLTVSASAQDIICVSACTLNTGQWFVAFTDVDPQATGYRLYVNGQLQSLVPAAAAPNEEFTVATGLAPAGTYSLVIGVISMAGMEVTSDPLTVTVSDPAPVVPPAPPVVTPPAPVVTPPAPVVTPPAPSPAPAPPAPVKKHRHWWQWIFPWWR